ncbi:hypothetical protein ACVWYN_003565 [Pedobacter sp. UYP24]
MKTKTLLTCLASVTFFSLTTLAQSKTDSIKVSYSNQKDIKVNSSPAFYLNGVLIGKHFPIVNQLEISSIIVKNETPSGEVYITTKEQNITFLSPEQIKEKYVKNASKTALYSIDGKIVHDVNVQIEENYILAINVIDADDVHLNFGDQKLTVINILTRSKENIAASKVVMIRGNAK